MSAILMVLGIVWVVSGLLAYRLDFQFWKRMRNLKYDKRVYFRAHHLRIRSLRIPYFLSPYVVTEYFSGNAEVHRAVNNRAMVSGVLGPLGLADAVMASRQFMK